MNKYILHINGWYDRLLSSAIAYNEKKKLKGFLNRNGYKPTDSISRNKWNKRWSTLGSTSLVFYDYYCKFLGEDINIVPDDLMHNIIEPLMNPIRYRGLYADKNMFDKFLRPYFAEKITPLTLIRCINGGLYDENYYSVEYDDFISIIQSSKASYLVVKPSIDSSSGNNILFFCKKENTYFLKDTDTEISFSLLIHKLGNNFIIQEGLKQSVFMEQFNSTSINTLRIATYKSVKDEKSIVLNGVLRIGKKGSSVDNLHAGGCMVGVWPDGELRNFCSDQYGNKFKEFNGVNFEQQKFNLPNYEEIKDFASRVAACIPHQRVLALDIMLDEGNHPKLIEFNNCAFSVWVFQQTIGTVFGQYTEEVIDYCKEHRKEATRIYLTY